MKIKKLSLLILVGLSSISVASNLPYHDVVLSASAKYGYDPLLIHAVIEKESSHRNTARSGVGPSGVMQIMPEKPKSQGVRKHNEAVARGNAGARYLKQLDSEFGNVPRALYAYNRGMGNLRAYLEGTKKVMPRDAQGY